MMGLQIILGTLSLLLMCADVSTDDVSYISPMILGRSFDKSTSLVGVDLFDTTEREKVSCHSVAETEVTYQLIQDESDVKDVLDISGQLSLQVKAGLAKVDGKGSYLKDQKKGKKFVEVLVLVNKKTIKRSLEGSPLKTISADKNRIPGEHYVKHIIYGGILVASLRFEYTDEQNKEDIKAEIKGEIGGTKKTSAFTASVKGKFQKLANRTKDKSRLEISYYANVPLAIVPTDMTKFIQLILRFGDDFKTSSIIQSEQLSNSCQSLKNIATGVPITVSLADIADISAGYTTSRESKSLKTAMQRLETDYDNLLYAKTRIDDVLKDTIFLPSKEEKTLGLFYDKIFSLIGLFKTTIANIKLSKDKSQFSKAFNAYEAFRKTMTTGDIYTEADEHVKRVKNILTKKTTTTPSSGEDTVEDIVGKIFRQIHLFKQSNTEKIGGIQNKAKKFTEAVNLFDEKVTNSFVDYSSTYDPNNPTFTCPKNGLYLLSNVVTAKNMDLGGNAEAAECGKRDYTLMQSRIVKKKAGDQVTVQGNSQFLGLLIQPE